MTPTSNDSTGNATGTNVTATVVTAPAVRDVREIIRDEQFMRAPILAALEVGPLTLPDIAQAIGRPTHEVVFWVMGMRKYGYVAEIKEATEEGYFFYQAIPREGS